MITIYTTNSCASCRKAKQWFNEHRIVFKEKNMFSNPVTKEDIIKILENTENGFEDIISTRSKIIVENNIDIDSMKFNDLVDFIIKNPSVLRRPIIVDDNKLQVGYNDEDIRIFIPRELRRKISCADCTEDCEYQKALRSALELDK